VASIPYLSDLLFFLSMLLNHGRAGRWGATPADPVYLSTLPLLTLPSCLDVGHPKYLPYHLTEVPYLPTTYYLLPIYPHTYYPLFLSCSIEMLSHHVFPTLPQPVTVLCSAPMSIYIGVVRTSPASHPQSSTYIYWSLNS
jgi:hypothetical protein